jgi:hypothetical protein
MIAKLEAIEIMKRRDTWQPEDYGDSWESPQEIERMRFFLKREFDRRSEVEWDQLSRRRAGGFSLRSSTR